MSVYKLFLHKPQPKENWIVKLARTTTVRVGGISFGMKLLRSRLILFILFPMLDCQAVTQI